MGRHVRRVYPDDNLHVNDQGKPRLPLRLFKYHHNILQIHKEMGHKIITFITPNAYAEAKQKI